MDVLTSLSDSRQEAVENMERRISGVSYMCWISTTRFCVVGFLCARLISFLFCRMSIFRLPRRGLPRYIYTSRATTPLLPLHSYHACVYPCYHAKGYHAPYLPPRAITPVYTSRLPHQSYHASPYLVHRVNTPAISNSYFCSFHFTGFYATSSPPIPPPGATRYNLCLLYTSPSPRDLSTSRMPSSA